MEGMSGWTVEEQVEWMGWWVGEWWMVRELMKRWMGGWVDRWKGGVDGDDWC